MISYLRGEPAGRRVQELLAQAKTGQITLYLCLINYGEVMYISERRGGRQAAELAISIIDNLPLEVVSVDRKLTFAAAHIKARYPLSFSDTFVIASAQMLNATVVTGDPEFKKAEGLVPIEWLG